MLESRFTEREFKTPITCLLTGHRSANKLTSNNGLRISFDKRPTRLTYPHYKKTLQKKKKHVSQRGKN